MGPTMDTLQVLTSLQELQVSQGVTLKLIDLPARTLARRKKGRHSPH